MGGRHSGCRCSQPAAMKHWFAGQMGIEAAAGRALSACPQSIQITSDDDVQSYFVLGLLSTGSCPKLFTNRVLVSVSLCAPLLVGSSHMGFSVQRRHQACSTSGPLRGLFLRRNASPPHHPPAAPWLPPLLEVLALQCLPYHPVSDHMVLVSTPHPPSLVHLLYPEHTSSYIGHLLYFVHCLPT